MHTEMNRVIISLKSKKVKKILVKNDKNILITINKASIIRIITYPSILKSYESSAGSINLELEIKETDGSNKDILITNMNNKDGKEKIEGDIIDRINISLLND